MADLNLFTATAKVDVPFEQFTNEEGKVCARGRLVMHNYKDFYTRPWVVVEGKKVEKVLQLVEGDSVKVKNAYLKSDNKVLEVKVPVRVLTPSGLEVQEQTFTKNYTDVYVLIDERDGSDLSISDHVSGEHDLNSFSFTGRICTDPQSKIVGRNKNALSFVAATNFAKRDSKPSYLYCVVEGREAARLEGRLAVNSKFSGSSILRTKVKPYIFEYEETEIDEDASVNGMIRYKQVAKTVEMDVEQLEVLFLDYVGQLNFIDNIKNPDLAEQFGEV